MKRKELTSSQMDDVIRLRERSISWLGIQRKTDIPRRVAQRAYTELLQRRISEKLSAVRHALAEEDLREHRKLLLELARQLVDLTSIPELGEPSSFLFQVGAEERLAGIWRANRWVDSILDGVIPTSENKFSQRQKRQIERRNRMLFRSLQAHTKGRGSPWQTLDNWKSAWDSCKDDLENLEREIHRKVAETLVSAVDLKVILNEAGAERAIGKISRELNGLMRQSLLAGFSGFKLDVSPGRPRDTTGDKHTTRRYSVTDWQIPATDDKSLKILCSLLNKIVGEEYSGDRVERIQSNLARVRKTALEIEESLDPLILSPLIPATRCDLCPV